MNPELIDQLKPIFTEVGAVVQASQQMEVGIGFALTLLKQISESNLTDNEFDESIELLSKKTLGRLIVNRHAKMTHLEG